MSEDNNSEPAEDQNGFFDGIEELEDEDQTPLLEPKNRPRGILSHTDREYLCGQKEYKHAQSEANRRQEIRERISNGLQDFTMLWWLLDADERDQIFDEMDSEILFECLSGMIAFSYLGLDKDDERLEEVVNRGVYLGANYDSTDRSMGKATDVNTSIDIKYDPNIDELYERLQNGQGDQLTPAEIGVLVREGKLEQSDLVQLESKDDDPHTSALSAATFVGMGNVAADDVPRFFFAREQESESNKENSEE